MGSINIRKFIEEARSIINSRLDYFESELYSLDLGSDEKTEEYRSVIINDINDHLMSISIKEENESIDRDEEENRDR